MAIKLGPVTSTQGHVYSIGRPQNWHIEPDNRRELVQTVGGVIVENYGHVSSGDKITFTAVFTAADATTVIGFCDGWTRVSLVAQDGKRYAGHVMVRGIRDVRLLEAKYKELDLEFWQV